MMEKHEFAGQQVTTKDGETFTVEDWADTVLGGSVWMANGNPAALVYAIRAAKKHLPIDSQAVYGKFGNIAGIIHDSEIVR